MQKIYTLHIKYNERIILILVSKRINVAELRHLAYGSEKRYFTFIFKRKHTRYINNGKLQRRQLQL